MLNGPLCHESAACREKRVKAQNRLLYNDHKDPVIFVGMGTCGLGAGAGKTMQAIEKHTKQKKIPCTIVSTGCIGLCSAEPIVDIKLPGMARLSFKQVTEENVVGLIDDVLKKKIPAGFLLGQVISGTDRQWDDLPELKDHPFFKPQVRFVLEN